MLPIRDLPCGGMPRDGLPAEGLPVDGLPVEGMPMSGMSNHGSHIGKGATHTGMSRNGVCSYILSQLKTPRGEEDHEE